MEHIAKKMQNRKTIFKICVVRLVAGAEVTRWEEDCKSKVAMFTVTSRLQYRCVQC